MESSAGSLIEAYPLGNIMLIVTKLNIITVVVMAQSNCNLHEHVRPCLPKPTSRLRHRLQYAGLWKCFSLHTWLPSSLTFCGKKIERHVNMLLVVIYFKRPVSFTY